MANLKIMNVQILVKRAEDCKPLNNKWLYVKKRDAEGSVTRYCARQVDSVNQQVLIKATSMLLWRDMER